MELMQKRHEVVDVSAVVCTMNSVASIERCLESLRTAGVGEIIVVDGGSSDGTREIAERLADCVLRDDGTGLGQARNIGIETATLPLILNFGSDNVLIEGALEGMLARVGEAGAAIVGAVTRIEGHSYLARAMDAYRVARYKPGPATVVGTPTLMNGRMLRANPYRPERRHSDDAELCERWADEFGVHFEIAPVEVLEIGKISFGDVWGRWKNYGVSDAEVYRAGSLSGWTRRRKLQSMMYPMRQELLRPAREMLGDKSIRYVPFLGLITARRYMTWAEQAVREARSSQAGSHRP
jgi:glycosyltransferase involved in cell wall biosynthesis